MGHIIRDLILDQQRNMLQRYCWGNRKLWIWTEGETVLCLDKRVPFFLGSIYVIIKQMWQSVGKYGPRAYGNCIIVLLKEKVLALVQLVEYGPMHLVVIGLIQDTCPGGRLTRCAGGG